MGCHTWFYKKIDRSYPVALSKLQNEFKKNIKRWEEIVSNPNDKIRIAYNWTQEECEWTLNVIKRKLQVISKFYCKVAVMNNQPDDDDGEIYFYHDNNLYATNDDLPHDLFRIGGYPNNKLMSLEETLMFIEKNKEHMFFGENWESELRKFWNENPDGVIEFG